MLNFNKFFIILSYIITIMNNDESFKIIQEMLSLININVNDINSLEGLNINRENLLSTNIINLFQSKKNDVKELGYSSSKLTSLHSNNNEKQQFPGINMLRQLLKCNNFKLKPYVKSMGYDKSSGKKIVYRYYIIHKINNDLPSSLVPESNVDNDSD